MQTILIELVKIITDNPANIGIFFLLFVSLAVWITCKVKDFYYKNCKVRKDNQERIDREFNEIKKEGEERDSKINLIIHKINNICHSLKIEDIAPTNLYQANSPLALTDLGRELMIDCGANDVYKELKAFFIEKVKKESPFSNYLDFEEKCFNVIFVESNNKAFDQVKNFVYENPTYKKAPISLFNIIKMLSIILRNELLINNKDIVKTS